MQISDPVGIDQKSAFHCDRVIAASFLLQRVEYLKTFQGPALGTYPGMLLPACRSGYATTCANA